MRPKETETPEMLLARFDKRIQQLLGDEIKSWYDEYVKLKRFAKTTNICRCCTHMVTGKLPGDGNHDGMKDHKPKINNRTYGRVMQHYRGWHETKSSLRNL